MNPANTARYTIWHTNKDFVMKLVWNSTNDSSKELARILIKKSVDNIAFVSVNISIQKFIFRTNELSKKQKQLLLEELIK